MRVKEVVEFRYGKQSFQSVRSQAGAWERVKNYTANNIRKWDRPPAYRLEKMRIAFIANILFIFSSGSAFADMPPAALRSVDFVKDVQPILHTACLKCHGPLRQEGEYRLDVRHVALTGGASYAPNIVPFDSASSPLIQFVAGESDGMQMPSKGQRLSDEIGRAHV